jgi:tetratricopeptide (TPR) repeat protein
VASSSDPEELIKEAYAALDDDELPRALEISGKLIEARYARGFEIMALALEKQDRYEDAIDVLRKGVMAVPDAYPLWELMGNLYAKEKDFSKAETAYVTALACPGSSTASVSYNMAVMLRQSGNPEHALSIVNEIRSPGLAVRVKTLRVSLLNSLKRYDEASQLANALVSEIMAQEELGDEDMKDLAQVYAELGRSIYLGSGNKQGAFESAWKALEWERSEPTALWLVRELIGRKSAESRWFRFEVEGNWYFPLEQGKSPPKFKVTYDIVADNVDEAMMFAKHLEPPEIRDSMQIKAVSDRGSHANFTQGLYWRSPYNFVLG